MNHRVKWFREVPKDFLCVQRNGDTGEFYYSESYVEKIISGFSTNALSFIKAARDKSETYSSVLLFYGEQVPDNMF